MTGHLLRPALSFTQPADYRTFQHRLRSALLKHPIRLVAYCVMPSRWHLIVGPTDPAKVQRCLAWVLATRPPGTERVTVRPLSAIRDLVRKTRHVERLALSAGLVRRAQDWPWGSLSGRLDSANPLPLVPAPFLESRAWTDYVNAPADWISVDVPQDPGRFSRRLQRLEHGRGL